MKNLDMSWHVANKNAVLQIYRLIRCTDVAKKLIFEERH